MNYSDTMQLVYSYLLLDEVYKINNYKIFYVNIPLYLQYNKNNITMNQVSRRGYLEVVIYLHSIGKVCTKYAMDWASRNDHLEVVKYLHRIRKK